jgi:hypothetical protein
LCFDLLVLDVLNEGASSPNWILYETITHKSVGKGEQHTAWVLHRKAQADSPHHQIVSPNFNSIFLSDVQKLVTDPLLDILVAKYLTSGDQADHASGVAPSETIPGQSTLQHLLDVSLISFMMLMIRSSIVEVSLMLRLTHFLCTADSS